MLTKKRRSENNYSPLRHKGLNAHDVILFAIVQSGKNEISGNDLVRRSGISRTTIWKIRDILKDEGLIDYKTNGRRTTYYPTKLAINNFYFRSWIRSGELFGLLESRRIPISSPLCDIKYPDYVDYKPQRVRLEFALRIGILITYILLQYLSPTCASKLNYNQSIASSGITNRLIEESLKNVISPTKMLTILRQTLFASGHRFRISNANKSASDSFYTLEQTSFDNVMKIFIDVFPEAFDALQGISFDDAEDYAKKWIEWAKKRKEQQQCKHEYQIQITKKMERRYCPLCESKPEIARDAIIGSKELVQRLNAVRFSNNNCRNHRWNIYLESMPFVSFQCALCYKIVELPIESEEKLDAIKEEVDNRVGLNRVSICEDIEMFFHHNSNQRLTVDHYIRYYKNRYSQMEIIDLKAFTLEIKTIFDILAENGYIDCINKNDTTNKPLAYIRREHVEIKSITGKKLLTLALDQMC